jgi:hypothetical protein
LADSSLSPFPHSPFKRYQEAAAIEHEMGRRIIYASSLTQLGRVLRQQGNLEKLAEEVRKELGAK